ncbi:MAG TPA: hypothetical protein VK053_21440, partial [Jiangellaceae bacterium]|nr:hypothetical protein [Jiangellaceae bacterium]
MNRTEALQWLAETVAATTPPVLTDQQLEAFLDAARIVDPDGRAPIDDGYVETFDLNYAAAEAFEAKAVAALAGDTGGLESFTSEGSAFKRRAGTGYDGFMALAASFRARSTAGGGSISVIALEPHGGQMP